jgi:hypothetical protein
MTSFIASDGHLLSMAVTEGAGVGGPKSLGLWGAGPVRAFARKIAKLNTKSPSTGEGGLNLQGLWGCHRSEGTRIYPQNSTEYFFLEGEGGSEETGKQRVEN